MNIVHISIDDVICVFKKLTCTKPSSIFNLHFFRYLKRIHEKYDLKVSCYCFYLYENFTLASCTRVYRKEFEANSDWLRFGFHGYSGKEDYGIQDEMESEKQYELVMGNLAEIVGIKALDTDNKNSQISSNKSIYDVYDAYRISYACFVCRR